MFGADGDLRRISHVAYKGCTSCHDLLVCGSVHRGILSLLEDGFANNFRSHDRRGQLVRPGGPGFFGPAATITAWRFPETRA